MKTSTRKQTSLVAYAFARATIKRDMGKYSTAELYEVTARHFKRFLDGRSCKPANLTITLVNDFSCYLQTKGLKRNSINSYLSCLRAIYNAALSEHLVPKGQDNPFMRYRFKRESTPKKALPMKELQRLAEQGSSDSPDEQKAIALALFSFSAFGMPFIDVAHLRKSNLQGDELCYQRHKTGISIRIGLTPGMRYYIQRYADPNSPYLFPMGQSPTGEPFSHAAYKRLLAEHNRLLRQVGKRLGLAQPLTSYVMRHSWASIALANEMPVAMISQALGHTSEATTRSYLKRIDQSALDKANADIIRGIEKIIISKGKRLTSGIS